MKGQREGGAGEGGEGEGEAEGEGEREGERAPTLGLTVVLLNAESYETEHTYS